jgi:hypothetical protein
MMMSETTNGRCFCGAVEVAVSGQPKVMGYCHCSSCRSWSAGPVNAFTLWDPQAVTVTKGKDKLATYNKTESSLRQFCRQCGGHVMTDHPPMRLIDVYAATIPDLAFAPQFHVHYAETVLPIRDGLPKFKDLPEEVGGSGVRLPE